MKILLALAVMILAGADARAQEEEAIRAGKLVAEQLLPLRDCLKNEFASVRPASNEEAQLIARTACADVASTARLNLMEATKALLKLLPPGTDPDKLVDGALNTARAAAYFDFTGEAKALQEHIKKRAEEQLRKR